MPQSARLRAVASLATLLVLAGCGGTAATVANTPPPGPGPLATTPPSSEPASTGLNGGPVLVKPTPF